MRPRWTRLTIIELFVVAVLVAAAVSVGVWWNSRARSLDTIETMKDDLRNLAVAQDAYAADNEGAFIPQNSRVTTTLPHYGYAPSAGVTVNIAEPAPGTWSATAAHELAPGAVCGIFVGEPPPETNPATEPGEPGCSR
jgi:type IV pilus assembly protein PilA